MKYIYAALLLHSTGQQVTEEKMKKILGASGIEVDEVRVKALVAALSEINIEEAIKSSMAMMAPVPATASPPSAEAKKEEKKPEEEKKKEEEALAGLGALFG